MEYKFENISLSLSNKMIFENFSLNLEKGKIYAVIGSSGIGKTTFLNLFSKLLKPISGKIKTNNEISYQFQNPILLNYLTVLENCYLGMHLKASNLENDFNIQELLLDFGFDESDFNKFPSELSGGMKQRVSIIQTLLVKSKLYLFDEPFNSIDGKNINIIINYLWKIQRKEKSTFFIVTHNLEQAITFCDEVIILKNDKTVSRIRFDDYFINLNPSERKTSTKFINYIAKILNASD